MSIESIIGIISGIITIVTAVLSIEIIKPISTTKLFDKLTDKEQTDVQHQRALKRLNRSKLLKGRINQEYIMSFRLNGKGREKVLFELCDFNDIEPTDDVCIGLIGSRMPSLKAKYSERREEGTHVVYMSELLRDRYPKVCSKLVNILERHNKKYAFIKGTKDIWCRDYMPVQTPSGKFIQFRYDPSYLKGKAEWEMSRSDVKEVCRLNNIDAEFSDINLDGGNVLICEGRAIVSDRIFTENPEWNKDELVSELSKLLECEVIIIPAENDDMTGHADGMVRFVDRNTVIGNKMSDEYKYWQKGMQKVIKEYGLKYIDLPFFTDTKDSRHPVSAVGVYVNYLEVENLIVVPIFGTKEDEVALSIIKKTFADKTIETIDYTEVAKEGGLLNCTTWVVLTRENN